MEEKKPVREKKPIQKKADINSKPIKYLNHRIAGHNKLEAERLAGYKSHNHSSRIEATKTYQAGLQEYLLKAVDVAKEHNKNIVQDFDKGAKNKAIDMYYKLTKAYPKDDTNLDFGDLSITIKKN